MKKKCPRCGILFECLHDEDISLCHCVTVELDSRYRNYLHENYPGCLCHNCLEKIKEILKANELNLYQNFNQNEEYERTNKR